MPFYDPNGYMQYEAIRDYYERLSKDTPEGVVNHLWYNILREYFFNSEGFQLEEDEMIILYVKHNKNTTLILVVDNRVSLETDSASWSNAVNELTNHMKLARSDFPEGQVAETIFGIATVGHYSRLYIMEPGQSTLTDHPTTAGGLLEFRKDESQIVSLLLSIKSQASPVVFERADLDPGSGGPGQ